MSYAIAQYPTPVLGTADFKMCFGGNSGENLLLDTQRLLRPVETVLFPLSSLTLLDKIPDSYIWRIQTDEYPHPHPIYIDERFVSPLSVAPPPRQRHLPSLQCICQHLLEQLGARYIWGGNWPQGIPQLLHWYAPTVLQEKLDAFTQDTWQLKGVDCSGLLYFACNGTTPRNTSQLVEWGFPVSIENKSLSEICSALLPLDLIVWKGHVIIVLDTDTTIESKEGAGVILCSLKERLEEILEKKIPFVIRRWHPEAVIHTLPR